MKKHIPTFKNEDEERKFWATHDSTEFVEWSKAKRAVFPKLKVFLAEKVQEELRHGHARSA